jgi:hypothetical protein
LHPFTFKPHAIILYGWVILHGIYIYIYIYIYHKFLIHSSVVRHLSCFQSLAIVSAVMNICVQGFLLYPAYDPLGRCPGVVSLDQMAVLSLVFWGMSILLSIMVVLICIPTSSV